MRANGEVKRRVSSFRIHSERIKSQPNEKFESIDLTTFRSSFQSTESVRIEETQMFLGLFLAVLRADEVVHEIQAPNISMSGADSKHCVAVVIAYQGIALVIQQCLQK